MSRTYFYVINFIILLFVSLSTQADDFSRLGKGKACYENGMKIKDTRLSGDEISKARYQAQAGEKYTINRKTGEKRYTYQSDGGEHICFVKDADIKLRCYIDSKIIFESAYSDIENFEAAKRGFILQGIEDKNERKVYMFQPGNVICEAI